MNGSGSIEIEYLVQKGNFLIRKKYIYYFCIHYCSFVALLEFTTTNCGQ